MSNYHYKTKNRNLLQYDKSSIQDKVCRLDLCFLHILNKVYLELGISYTSRGQI